ncbi:MAG: hypothetical protein LBO81_00005, partial [Clostridiales Family XIII bacterium]|nr:hypothetical protein [Clostridiales Family XIII bacterium]
MTGKESCTMDILQQFPAIAEDARMLWERTDHAELSYAAIFDRYGGVKSGVGENRLIGGDNLAVAKTLLAGIRAGTQSAIHLIYMDPPFFTKTDYTSVLRISAENGHPEEIPLTVFSDTWRDVTADAGTGLSRYLTMLAARIIAARELLAESGCLWLH